MKYLRGANSDIKILKNICQFRRYSRRLSPSAENFADNTEQKSSVPLSAISQLAQSQQITSGGAGGAGVQTGGAHI